MKIKTDFKTIGDYLKSLNDLKRAKLSEQFVAEMLKRCDSVTKKNTPVDRGTLRNGWKIEFNANGNESEGVYYNDTEYATYVEFGHRTANHNGWVEGRFMLNKGIQATERSRERIAKRIIDKEITERLKK